MSLRWMEGFETLGATTGSTVEAQLNRKYGNFHGLTLYPVCDQAKLAAGRKAGYSLQGAYAYPTSSQRFFYVVASDDVPTSDTWIVGMAVKFGTSFPDNKEILVIGSGDSSPYYNFSIKVLSDGKISACGGGNTLLVTTTNPVLASETWHYVEANVVCHDTAGSYEIHIDGQTVLSGSGVDTRGSADSRYVLFQLQNYYQCIDDIYICDTDGTINNDFLGQVVIEGILPSAEADSSDWTPASGTDNAAMVDDIPPDDDTSYVESNTEDAKDLYDYANLSTITTETILGLQVNTDARMNAFPGDLDLYQSIKSGSTTSDGQPANIAIDEYEVATRILETDPDTSSAWIVSGVNAAQFGVKVGT